MHKQAKKGLLFYQLVRKTLFQIIFKFINKERYYNKKILIFLLKNYFLLFMNCEPRFKALSIPKSRRCWNKLKKTRQKKNEDLPKADLKSFKFYKNKK